MTPNDPCLRKGKLSRGPSGPVDPSRNYRSLVLLMFRSIIKVEYAEWVESSVVIMHSLSQLFTAFVFTCDTTTCLN